METSAPKHRQRINQDSEPRWTSLRHLNGISKALARHVQSHNIKVAHKPTATLRTNLVRDTISLDANSGVLYHFNAKDAIPIKSPQNSLKKNRMTQHKAAVMNMSYLTTVYFSDTGHCFAFNAVQIIGHVQSKACRLFIEVIHSDDNSMSRHITLDLCNALIKDRLIN